MMKTVTRAVTRGRVCFDVDARETYNQTGQSVTNMNDVQLGKDGKAPCLFVTGPSVETQFIFSSLMPVGPGV